MRVSIITDTFLPKVDGITTVICLLLDHLAACGVETIIFAPYAGKIDRYNQTPVITAPSLPFPFYPDLNMGLPTYNTYRALKSFQPHVVHFIHPSVFGLAAYVMVKRMGLPALVSYHQIGRASCRERV